MICIVGGANIDIQGFSNSEIVFNDSNPGYIEKGFGGVGRNIAENLSHLNTKVKLIAPLGTCNFSKEILEYMSNKNIDMSNCLILENEEISTYLSILNNDKEMILAISSMSILDKLDIKYIKSIEDILRKADVLVVDTNLKQDVIEYLSTLNKNNLIDLVSTKKTTKSVNVIGNFNTIKPNKIEVEILTGIKITDIESMKKASEILINKGVKNIFITLGKDGLFYMNKDKYELIPNPKIDVKDITGAGDAFSAGLAYSMFKKFPIEKAARVSLCMSLINVTNIGTCYQNLDENLLNEYLNKYFNISL